jgi:hypothetical protein
MKQIYSSKLIFMVTIEAAVKAKNQYLKCLNIKCRDL